MNSLTPPDEYEAEYMGDFEVVHREKISYPKPFFWIVGALLTLGVAAQIGLMASSGVALPVLLLPLFAFVLAAFVIAMMATLRVTVTSEKVAVQYGIFGPQIPIDSIVQCEAENYSLMKYGGYGIRFSPIDGSWAFNMLGDKGKAVRIHYKKKSGGIRKILIASQNHHLLADAINRQRLALGHDVPAHIVPDENTLQVDDVVFSGLEDDAESQIAQEAEVTQQKS